MGINDLKLFILNDVVDVIIELVREVEDVFEFEIVLFEFIVRNDDYSNVVKVVNKCLK